MKSFIIKLSIFGILYLISSIIISTFTPYHWGNPWYSTKIQFLEKNNQLRYDTFFFGSSRVYRQINPELFDSTFNSISQEKIKSFNLGAPATFNPQSYYLYEKFLDSRLSNNVKYCFIELMEVDLLNDYFMHQERTTYWQNLSDILFVEKSIYYNKQIDFNQKTTATSNYLISYFENIFHLGHFGKQILTRNYYDDKYLGSFKNGFFPLEYDFQTTTNKVTRKSLLERKKNLIQKPELIANRKSQISKSYANISATYDNINLNKIKELINKSKEKNINLIFILSPRNGSQKLLNLSRKIPKMNLIDLSNPQKYSIFYELENSFDVGHLNTQGATTYSEFLAVEFEKKTHKISSPHQGVIPLF